MMGRQHALGGAVASLAALPALTASYHLTPGQQALTVALAVGGGMVPDLDQHGSTIGRTYGPITDVVARAVAFIARGHRKGTHSLVGLLAFAAIAYWGARMGGVVTAVLVWLLLGVADRALDVIDSERFMWPLRCAVMAGVVALVLATGVDIRVPLLAGMILGSISHVVLDMLTDHGCPLLWPLVRTKFGVDIVTTGSRWTSPLVTGVLTVAVAYLALRVLPVHELLGRLT